MTIPGYMVVGCRSNWIVGVPNQSDQVEFRNKGAGNADGKSHNNLPVAHNQNN